MYVLSYPPLPPVPSHYIMVSGSSEDIFYLISIQPINTFYFFLVLDQADETDVVLLFLAIVFWCPNQGDTTTHILKVAGSTPLLITIGPLHQSFLASPALGKRQTILVLCKYSCFWLYKHYLFPFLEVGCWGSEAFGCLRLMIALDAIIETSLVYLVAGVLNIIIYPSVPGDC